MDLWLQRLWYGRHYLSIVLAPLGWLFHGLVVLRRALYVRGILAVNRLPIPVLVVGNLTVGGTGKTPLVIWLARSLSTRGRKVGVLCRGYGGSAKTWPVRVAPHADPAVVGDEAVLLAQSCACPVVAGPDRVAAGALFPPDLDLLISDDGLQHYRMARDGEIAVVDGARGLGNGRCLPAGPLREPAARLSNVDATVVNGAGTVPGLSMTMTMKDAQSLTDGTMRPLDTFRGRRVHAVAGIGNPQRFFAALEARGLDIDAHSFPDHTPFARGDFAFSDRADILVTQKDAVKCISFADSRFWCVPVEAGFEPTDAESLIALAERCMARAEQKGN